MVAPNDWLTHLVVTLAWVARATVFLVAAGGLFHYSTFHGGKNRVAFLRAGLLIAALAVFSLPLHPGFSVLAAVVFLASLFVPSKGPQRERR